MHIKNSGPAVLNGNYFSYNETSNEESTAAIKAAAWEYGHQWDE